MRKIALAFALLTLTASLVTVPAALAQDSFQIRGKTMSRTEAIAAVRAEARRKGMRNITAVNVGKDCEISTVCDNGKVSSCSISGKNTSCVCDTAIGCSCTVYLPNGDIDGTPAVCK